MSYKSRLVLLILTLLLPLSAMAGTNEVPHYMNFQSVLRDDSGNLIKDGFISLEFKILDQDGKELYYELQPGVQVIRSTVNVNIGEGVKPGSPSGPTGGIPMIALDPASGDKLLQMRIDGNLAGEPMSLNTVPYAMYAEKALNIVEDIALDQLPSVIATDEEVKVVETNLQGQITTLQGVVSNIGNLPGVLNDNQIPGSITRDSEYQAGDATLQTNINSETLTRASTDSDLQSQINGKVSKGGDTMTGDLNMGGKNITNVGNVDGVDVGGLATTVADHETKINELKGANKLPCGTVQAWGIVNGASGSITVGCNATSAKTGAGNPTDYTITMNQPANSINYPVLVTPFSLAKTAAGNINLSKFTVTIETNSVGFYFLVPVPGQ